MQGRVFRIADDVNDVPAWWQKLRERGNKRLGSSTKGRTPNIDLVAKLSIVAIYALFERLS